MKTLRNQSILWFAIGTSFFFQEVHSQIDLDLAYHYPMASGKTVVDLLGELHGEVIGEVEFKTVGGRQGAFFNGSGSIQLRPPKDAKVIAFWMWPGEAAGQLIDTTYTGRLQVRYDGRGYVTGPGHMIPEVMAIAPDHREEWHLIVFLRGDEENKSTMYVDGERVEITAQVQGPRFNSGGGGWFLADFHPRVYLGASPAGGDGFRGGLSDLAFWRRRLSGDEIQGLWESGRDGQSLQELLPDGDQDGLPDVWELSQGFSSEIQNGNEDPDRDGLPNIEEYSRGLDPYLDDTDGDLISDSEEIEGGTDPLRSDTDDDGLGDWIEGRLGSNPGLWDTDGDGFSDGDEQIQSTEPLDPNSKPDLGLLLRAYWTFDETIADEQGEVESVYGWRTNKTSLPVFEQGIVPGGAIRFHEDDYIDISDGAESLGISGNSFTVAFWAKLEATSKGENWVLCQGDGRHLNIFSLGSDSGADPMQHKSGWNFYLLRGANPVHDYTFSQRHDWNTGDGAWHHVAAVYESPRGGYNGGETTAPRIYIDGAEQVSTGYTPLHLSPGLKGKSDHRMRIGGYLFSNTRGWDGLLDEMAIWERALGTSEVRAIYRAAVEEHKSIKDLLSPDTDQDRMPDSWEIQNGMSPEVPDADGDADNDGLTNLEEYREGTDPLNADSDGDGYTDAVETNTGRWVSALDTGSDPLNTDSDGDGLLDGFEDRSMPFVIGRHPGTDPNLRDTDGDGHSDFTEFSYDANPTVGVLGPRLDQGLLAYWPLDEDLKDHYGPHHGAARGSGQLRHHEAQFGHGILLDGVDQSVEITEGAANAFSFSNGKSVSLSVWFRSDPSPRVCPTDFCWHDLGLVSKGTSGIHNFKLAIERGRLVFQTQRLSSLGPIDSLLHHLVGVTDAENQSTTVYLDGKRIGGSNVFAAMVDTKHRLRLGAHPEGDEVGPTTIYRHWSGLLDDIAIWDRPLAATEVAKLYTSGTSLNVLADLVNHPNPRLDSDGDGMSDGAEVLAGTDLKDPTDVLRIVRITRRQEEVVLEWTSVIGKRYMVEHATDLERKTWSPIMAEPIMATARQSLFETRDGEGEATKQAYYRVRVID